MSTSCLTGLDLSVLQIKTKIVSSHTADSKPVKQDVNSTVILPPLVFPAEITKVSMTKKKFLPTLTTGEGADRHAGLRPHVHLGGSEQL
jgi:hypothetical protein